jgi:RNA polymerase sigma factor for flagellar operon FliA
MNGTVGSPVAEGTRTDDPTVALWRKYRRSGDLNARRELLERHLHLVRLLARKLASRIGGLVEVDDLVSAGTLGLVQALESYDMSRGNSFATFASRRVSGAMLDELRHRDWVPRSVRAKARQLGHAASRLESELGRSAQPRELAKVLGIDEPTYWSWREAVDGAVLMSLDESPSPSAPSGESLAAPDAVDSLEDLSREENLAALAGVLGTLPERERTVLVLYYYEEMNLRQIAEVLHLTESRISQIRTAALKKMRTFLAPAM